MTRALLLAVAAVLPLAAQLPPGDWKTDLSRRSIDLAELKSGGPPKDGIPAIDRPKFVTPAQASEWLHPKELVMVVERGGEARAYPLQILVWHELVNDQIGDLPILVSYCPLCNSGLVFDRRVEGRVYDFGVSGLLRHNDLVMYDRRTDSLWQQIGGEAIVGMLTGKKLKTVRNQTIPFRTFQEAFPGGRVLSRDTGHRRDYGRNPYAGYEFGGCLLALVSLRKPARLALLERVVGMEHLGSSKAYSFGFLRRQRLVEGRLKQQRFVIFFEEGALSALDQARIAGSRDVGSVGVFSPELDGRRLGFRRKDGRIVDKQTGSAWNLLGVATDGPLAGRRLAPLDHGVYFAFAWLVFNPDAEIVGDSGPGVDLSEELSRIERGRP